MIYRPGENIKSVSRDSPEDLHRETETRQEPQGNEMKIFLANREKGKQYRASCFREIGAKRATMRALARENERSTFRSRMHATDTGELFFGTHTSRPYRYAPIESEVDRDKPGVNLSLSLSPSLSRARAYVRMHVQ
jgi:hypothetical protein